MIIARNVTFTEPILFTAKERCNKEWTNHY